MTKTFSLGIVGSRNISDKDLIYTILDKVKAKLVSQDKSLQIISGGAKGVDSIAEDWAKLNDVDALIFIPQWIKYGKRAGFIRNEDIVKRSNYVIAFWDGKSKGTQHSIELCKRFNIKYKIIILNINNYE